MKRPGSLAEVALLGGQSRSQLGYAIVEFLDQFKIEKRAAMLADEPALLNEQLQDQGIADAYLAAVAVLFEPIDRASSARLDGCPGPLPTEAVVRESGRVAARDFAPGKPGRFP